MKSTIVPAQITSVEDRIAGNLSFKQLLLFMAPVFLGAAIFAFMPPFATFQMYKLVIASVIAFVCIVLAVRIRGRLIAEWITLLSRYNARPRHYVFSKTSTYLRPELPVAEVAVEEEQTEEADKPVTEPKLASLNPLESFSLENAISNPAADFHFSVSKKGGLRAHIKEIR